MQRAEERDPFDLLESRIESLIRSAGTLKKEKESLQEKVNIQEEKIANLSAELEHLRAARDKARQKIVFLLEKLDQVNLTS